MKSTASTVSVLNNQKTRKWIQEGFSGINEGSPVKLAVNTLDENSSNQLPEAYQSEKLVNTMADLGIKPLYQDKDITCYQYPDYLKGWATDKGLKTKGELFFKDVRSSETENLPGLLWWSCKDKKRREKSFSENLCEMGVEIRFSNWIQDIQRTNNSDTSFRAKSQQKYRQFDLISTKSILPIGSEECSIRTPTRPKRLRKRNSTRNRKSPISQFYTENPIKTPEKTTADSQNASKDSNDASKASKEASKTPKTSFNSLPSLSSPQYLPPISLPLQPISLSPPSLKLSSFHSLCDILFNQYIHMNLVNIDTDYNTQHNPFLSQVLEVLQRAACQYRGHSRGQSADRDTGGKKNKSRHCLKTSKIPKELLRKKEHIRLEMEEGIVFTRFKRNDHLLKKFHSKARNQIYANYCGDFTKSNVFDRLREVFKIFKQPCMDIVLENLMGSNLKNGLTTDSISLVLLDDQLFEVFFSESNFMRVLQKLNEQTICDIRSNILAAFQEYLDSDGDLAVIKRHLHERRTCKLPCSYLDNLNCCRAFIERFHYRALALRSNKGPVSSKKIYGTAKEGHQVRSQKLPSESDKSQGLSDSPLKPSQASLSSQEEVLSKRRPSGPHPLRPNSPHCMASMNKVCNEISALMAQRDPRALMDRRIAVFKALRARLDSIEKSNGWDIPGYRPDPKQLLSYFRLVNLEDIIELTQNQRKELGFEESFSAPLEEPKKSLLEGQQPTSLDKVYDNGDCDCDSGLVKEAGSD